MLKVLISQTIGSKMNVLKLFIATSGLLGVVACAPIQAPVDTTAKLECTPVAANNILVGNWLSIGSQKGVAGAVRTLYTLNADGSMEFVQQIKRSQMPSQGISETGCWQRNGNVLVIKTDKSNGVPVNLDDPIYTSNYFIVKLDQTELQLKNDTGLLHAKRMSSGYRLPF